jgi:hypothetical protein
VSCRGESAEVPADELGWTSLREEKASLDCKISKNQLQMGLERLVDLSTISNGSTRCSQKHAEGAELEEEKACLDSLNTKNQPEWGLERAQRIIHHVLGQHQMSDRLHSGLRWPV